jgi:phosphoribosylaminoimidazole (AIR) synthetase
VLGKNYAVKIDLDKLDVPPVFSWLAKAGGVAESEMLRTFNCGVGMVAIVAEGQAAQVAAVLQAENLAVAPIGRVRPKRDESVVYLGELAL